MSPTRAPKKSETLEVRIPYAAKQAFMARCRAEGRSASEAVRDFIDGRLGARPVMGLRRKLQLAIAAALAAAVGVAAAPSFARPALGGGFDGLDANRDGRVSLAEFHRLDADRDGAVSAAEARAAR